MSGLADIAIIKLRLSYWPNSGEVCYKFQHFNNPTSRQKQWNTRFAGKAAGYLNTNGYWRISLGPNNQEWYAHQIAFAIMLNYIPIEVDHIDKNKLNNAWLNLRDIEHSNNMSNVFKRSTNSSGLKGVSWAKWNNCWRMDITANGVKYHSYHTTKEEAYADYCLMSTKLHGEFGCAD